MGINNFFYEGKRLVQGFVKAKLSPEKKQEGENPNPKFDKLPKNEKVNLG